MTLPDDTPLRALPIVAQLPSVYKFTRVFFCDCGASDWCIGNTSLNVDELSDLPLLALICVCACNGCLSLCLKFSVPFCFQFIYFLISNPVASFFFLTN